MEDAIDFTVSQKQCMVSRNPRLNVKVGSLPGQERHGGIGSGDALGSVIPVSVRCCEP